MYLNNIYEKFEKNTLKVLEISTKREVYSPDEAADLGYDDFICLLYIAGELKGEISGVLADAGVWTDMIDSVNWHEMYCDRKMDEAV